jgi:serine phosphatase RsbU (regulator of sigma subunit)
MKYLFRNWFIGICYCFPLLVSAQSNVVDSLLQHLSKKIKDSVQVNLRVRISDALRKAGKPANAMAFGREAQALAEEIHDEHGIANAILCLAKCEDGQSNLDTAIALYNRCLEQFKQQKDLTGQGNAELGLGNAWDAKGNEEKALEHYIRSLHARESTADSAGIAGALVGIANVYVTTRQLNNSLANYLKAYGMYKRQGNKTMVSWILNNIGTAYYDSGDNTHAIEYFKESVTMKKELGDSMGLSTTYNNLINIFSEQKDPVEACHYAQLAYNIRKGGEDVLAFAFSSNNLGMALLALNDYRKAAICFDDALQIGLKQKAYTILATSYQGLARVHSAMGEWKEAYLQQDLAAAANDSAFNIENRKQINELSARFENAKKDKAIIEKDARIKAEMAESRQSSLERNIVLVALLGAMALAFFIYRSYRQKQKAHAEISRQKIIIEMKNKETMDSIHYAKRIQKALFAGEQLLKEKLNEHFILYKPKDIVSGDFYWAYGSRDRFLICMADCTGHGVPGAFMSLLNISFLNEVTIEKQITRPDLVLNSIRSSIIHALHTDENGGAQDGMDAVFCSFDFNAGKLEYAAANTNFYLIREGVLHTSLTDKMPVGKSPRDHIPFLLQVMELKKGDLIYLLTDGYADQFGGAKGKKIMYKQLEDVLLKNVHHPLAEQKQILENHFETWRGNLEQVDDVTIIGIRI